MGFFLYFFWGLPLVLSVWITSASDEGYKSVLVRFFLTVGVKLYCRCGGFVCFGWGDTLWYGGGMFSLVFSLLFFFLMIQLFPFSLNLISPE